MRTSSSRWTPATGNRGTSAPTGHPPRRTRTSEQPERRLGLVAVLVAFTPVRRRTHARKQAARPQPRTLLITPGPPDEQLESVLGSHPHEFESRILRQCLTGHDVEGPHRERWGPSSLFSALVVLVLFTGFFGGPYGFGDLPGDVKPSVPDDTSPESRNRPRPRRPAARSPRPPAASTTCRCRRRPLAGLSRGASPRERVATGARRGRAGAGPARSRGRAGTPWPARHQPPGPIPQHPHPAA